MSPSASPSNGDILEGKSFWTSFLCMFYLLLQILFYQKSVSGAQTWHESQEWLNRLLF